MTRSSFGWRWRRISVPRRCCPVGVPVINNPNPGKVSFVLKGEGKRQAESITAAPSSVVTFLRSHLFEPFWLGDLETLL